MSASISGTAELDPKSALTRMQKSEKYNEDRTKIEKQVQNLQTKISTQNPQIKPEDANKLARSLSTAVITYVANIGI